MVWQRRWFVLGGLLVAMAVAVAAGVNGDWRTGAPLGHHRSHLTAHTYHVIVATGGRPLVGAAGVALTQTVTRPAVLVLPGRARAWARRALSALTGQPVPVARPTLLTLTASEWRQVAAWGASGLRLVHPAAVAPAPGVPRALWTLLEEPYRLTHATLTAIVAGSGAGPVPVTRRAPVTGPVHLTIQVRWEHEIQQALPTNASLAMLGDRGDVLVLAANPPGLIRESHPVGLGVLPLLLAEAEDNPPLFAHLTGQNPLQWIPLIGRRWGATGVRRAYDSLGMASPPWPGVQVTPYPAADLTEAGLMMTGHGIWASSLAVARAWLPMVDKGGLPAITDLARARTSAPGPAAPLVATWSSLQRVATGLPVIQAGGWRVMSWDPAPYTLAVGVFERAGVARVVAVEGLSRATQWHHLLVSLAEVMGQSG